MKPLFQRINPALDPSEVFRRLVGRPHCLFLDSAMRHPTLGRYSFVTADPFEYVQFAADGSDGLARLHRCLRPLQAQTIPGLPPFQGGAAGLLGYDLGRSLERLPVPRHNEFAVPALAVGLYDVVVAFDHHRNEAWLVSQGFPEVEPLARRERATDRLNTFHEWITGDIEMGDGTPRSEDGITTDALAAQYSVPGPAGLTSNFSAAGYRQAIQRTIDYIHAGDIFQANIAQRLLYPPVDASAALYLRLRKRNPATFAGYFDLGDYQIVSASPERFLRVFDGQVEARPIKGTRGRAAHPVADLFTGDDLVRSQKDRAENVMIVDLLRNDISRVCEPDTVCVTQLCDLEVYEYVQHLVSSVHGRLRAGVTPIDLVRASFPGGSITGAPKVRAMEIIAELEPTARGAYCGSLGYIGFDGTMDLSILIRTITCGRGWWQLPVGGGIVAQSQPEREYEETWHKASGLLRALLP